MQMAAIQFETEANMLILIRKSETLLKILRIELITESWKQSTLA